MFGSTGRASHLGAPNKPLLLIVVGYFQPGFCTLRAPRWDLNLWTRTDEHNGCTLSSRCGSFDWLPAAAHLHTIRFFVSTLILFGASRVIVRAFREGQMCFCGVAATGPCSPADAVKKQEFSQVHLRKKPLYY